VASHRPLVAIFSLALVLRLAMVVALVLGWGADGFLIDDSASYLWRAAEERWQADMMPLYVLYLSAFRALLGPDPLWPVLGQALIDSLTCVVIAAAAGVLDHRLRLVAGVFAALNPTQIVMATLVLTDTLFLFFYALALWAALAWLERPSWRTAAGCGLALGLGVLTRAMLLPWVLALPVVLLAGGAVMRHRLAPASAQLALALALALALQAPVLARNHAETGGYGLTSQGGVHALYWIVPLVMEARDGTPHGEGARLMAERFAEVVDAANHPDPFSHSRAMSRAAVGVLGELGPGPIAKAWAFGAAINLFSPAVILSTPVRTLPRMGFYATPGESKLDKIVTFLFRNDNSAYTLILLAAATGTVLLRAVQLFGLWRAVRAGLAGKRTVLAATLVLAAWIGFVLVINGPIASAKYRSPAEPAFAVLFALALARRETLAGPFTAARAGV
jgi:4-amino-4-deoxy-L-arabinose transferase-like glycosyltransferase